ncbi:beta-ketoacyl synthase N-terminal-like domain-containing protein [Sabulicella glaciei]|uniref:Beta-ketoacyl synthase N-terminal-like domain-containing protein n=1 Tax=Sabulicella glaciei TaxID=2984948 RepID=A0ABT3NR89_9PROT|nr:beta-ketoacyl synthase N-terminal-like domain-containing protein [Roseococcus sp. MDT2-1-1]MCW8084671.1 beta-ketoacyl synthase N-terminal-like domain-containing protein [Roseococcus sp. MDT2-1-1]
MRIAVTGIGMVTALGWGAEANWEAMLAGRSGVRPITRFDTTGMRTRFAASVDLPEDRPRHPVSVAERSRRLGEAVIAEALAQAGLEAPFPGPLCIGLPPVEIEWPQRLELNAADYPGLIEAASGRLDLQAEFLFGGTATRLAERFGTRGVPQTVTTACASGSSAIQMAIEAIRRGETDCAIAAGAEASLQPETLIRFSLLQALSTRNDAAEKASRPFTLSRDGFVMADGAGALVLEREDHARARGAAILGYVLGAGEAADKFHRTRSTPDGSAIIRAMSRAIADAGLEPSAIGYVNAHGTSTPENDKMEALASHALFGEAPPPISSTKSMIGHTLSAAGAIEAAVCLLALRDQMLPPTINNEDPDPELRLDTVPVARKHRFEAALSNSFGFGGQNVSVVLGRAD